MAKVSVKVLKCDICEELQNSDDLTEEHGIEIRGSWFFASPTGGHGSAKKETYICYECCNKPLNEIVYEYYDNYYSK